jgi:hypothetical protein
MQCNISIVYTVCDDQIGVHSISSTLNFGHFFSVWCLVCSSLGWDFHGTISWLCCGDGMGLAAARLGPKLAFSGVGWGWNVLLHGAPQQLASECWSSQPLPGATCDLELSLSRSLSLSLSAFLSLPPPPVYILPYYAISSDGVMGGHSGKDTLSYRSLCKTPIHHSVVCCQPHSASASCAMSARDTQSVVTLAGAFSFWCHPNCSPLFRVFLLSPTSVPSSLPLFLSSFPSSLPFEGFVCDGRLMYGSAYLPKNRSLSHFWWLESHPSPSQHLPDVSDIAMEW